MAEEVPCPFAADAGGDCMDTVDVPGRIRNTFKRTPDELHDDVVASLHAYAVTNCTACGEDYTVEYVPE